MSRHIEILRRAHAEGVALSDHDLALIGGAVRADADDTDDTDESGVESRVDLIEGVRGPKPRIADYMDRPHEFAEACVRWARGERVDSSTRTDAAEEVRVYRTARGEFV